MTLFHISCPQILNDPKRSWSDIRVFLPIFLGVAALSGITLTLFMADSAAVRGAAILWLILVLCLTWVAIMYGRHPDSGTVRVAHTSDRLNLVPSWAVVLANPMCMMMCVVVGGYHWATFGSGGYSAARHLRLFLIVGIIGSIWELWKLRSPAGLSITPDCIYGVRGGASVDIPWTRLRDVSIDVAHGIGGGRYIYLHQEQGSPIRVDSRLTGTDVNVLYWTVRYFLEHPEQRELLRDPEAALRRVEEAYRGADHL
ncbi:hypothetical protein D9V34_15555 [Mycetocola lacteus]|uniref:PH domain-containing protein n=1 Tax=Mycetocola lacteus TaxID=76637 RepID=A0A3L7AFT4_9MICO|nr:hypothetical protein [Mycetocola lacteus]RLP79219.1 hypothetical protein D9V34_15555 [Mycetocola lacteus]